MFKYTVISMLVLLLLSACAAAVGETAVVEGGDATLVTVYRAPT
jgi:hypothetical protein